MINQFSKIVILIALTFTTVISKAQTPMQISGLDCNGVSHDMYSELDAGKAVVVFFFMDACGSCPPPAQKIQTMVNNILVNHPAMVTAYAMPFNNSTTCTATTNWVTNNSLSMLYSPYDSGAVQVANYGGFGMPSVVLLGGKAPNRRVMFSTLSFVSSDTTIMRDSILALFAPAGLDDLPINISSLEVYPNPASTNTTIEVELKALSQLQIDVLDISGRVVANIANEKNNGIIKKLFNTEAIANGTYTVRITVDGKVANRKLNVLH